MATVTGYWSSASLIATQTKVWNNLSSLLNSDTSEGYVNFQNKPSGVQWYSHIYRLYNFSQTIPSDATITGVRFSQMGRQLYYSGTSWIGTWLKFADVASEYKNLLGAWTDTTEGIRHSDNGTFEAPSYWNVTAAEAKDAFNSTSSSDGIDFYTGSYSSVFAGSCNFYSDWIRASVTYTVPNKVIFSNVL